MYLRWNYERHRDLKSYDRYEIIILQHLWNVYGLTTPNQSLLYATLCVARRSYEGEIEQKPWTEIQIDPHFMSRFLAALQDAINKDEITECHLFAVGLIAKILYYNGRCDDYRIHFKGILDMLNCLLDRQAKRRNFQSTNLSLQWLYPFILTSLSIWPILHTNGSKTNSSFTQEDLFLGYKAFLALGRMEIPSIGTSDDRAPHLLPIKFWSTVHLQRPFMWDDISRLSLDFRAKFRMEFSVHRDYYHQLEWGVRSEEESELLNATELEFEKVLMLPCVQEFLKYVSGANTCTSDGIVQF